MTEGLWAAVIGVGGTILGTIIGWVLNNLSNRGRLVISIVKYEAEFQKALNGVMCRCDINSAEYFNYIINIDIYNTSAKTKFMRDIKFNFVDEAGGLLKTITPYDKDLLINGRLTKHIKVQPINIVANSVISKILYFDEYKNDGFDFILSTEKFFMTYTNEKGKTKKILIKKGNIKDYYKEQEEQGNE